MPQTFTFLDAPVSRGDNVRLFRYVHYGVGLTFQVITVMTDMLLLSSIGRLYQEDRVTSSLTLVDLSVIGVIMWVPCVL